jgi:hypothetical protein
MNYPYGVNYKHFGFAIKFAMKFIIHFVNSQNISIILGRSIGFHEYIYRLESFQNEKTLITFVEMKMRDFIEKDLKSENKKLVNFNEYEIGDDVLKFLMENNNNNSKDFDDADCEACNNNIISPIPFYYKNSIELENSNLNNTRKKEKGPETSKSSFINNEDISKNSFSNNINNISIKGRRKGSIDNSDNIFLSPKKKKIYFKRNCFSVC